MTLAQLGQGRVLKGARNWWFLGPGGTARLHDSHVTGDGALLPATERSLRDRGLFTVTPDDAYSLTVLTSTDCNLGCAYCFQNTGQDDSGGTRPPRIAHARLASETITSILGFTRAQMAAGGYESFRLLLFGGEPLLNPRGCFELLARAADHGMTSAWMISNATLLTPPLARRLAELRLRTIQVTFDGDRDDHDAIRVRRSRNRGGTFDSIVRNIARASDGTTLRFTLRVNVSHHNHEGMDGLVGRLAAALDPSRCSIYFARVGDVGVGYGNDLLHTGELASRFTAWQRLALDAGFAVSRPRADVSCATCGPGDGRSGAVVNADGTLASCWETAGRPGWDVGTIDHGYLPPEQTRDRWVGCGDLYRYDEERRVLEQFRDTVDAALLDHLDATGRL